MQRTEPYDPQKEDGTRCVPWCGSCCGPSDGINACLDVGDGMEDALDALGASGLVVLSAVQGAQRLCSRPCYFGMFLNQVSIGGQRCAAAGCGQDQQAYEREQGKP